MKFLEHETLNQETIPSNTICLFGGNKKAYLGFFSEARQFWAFGQKQMIALPSNNVHILKLTGFSKDNIEDAKLKFTKETYSEIKEMIVSKRAKYTAAVLTQASGEKLFNIVKEKIPEGWTVNCHHMTICLGEAAEEVEYLMGESTQLKITGYGYSEEHQVIAMLVETDLFSKNEIKHITVALNKSEGAQAANSNKIKHFAVIQPFTLEAHIDSVLGNGTLLFGSEEYIHS